MMNEKENDTCIYFTWHDGSDWYKKKEQKKTWQEEVLLAIEVVGSIIRDTLYKEVVGGAERSGAEALLFESSFFLYFLSICFAELGMGCADMRDNIMICSSKYKLLLWILCGRRRLCCSTNRMQVRKRSNMIRKVYRGRQEQMIKR